MKIEVFGTGCCKCLDLYGLVREVTSRLRIDAEIIKVSDITDIVSRGIIRTPALAINGKIVCAGRIPKLEEVEDWVKGDESMQSSLVNEAVRKFKEGLTCSQAILITYGKQYGINENTAKTIARSFGGGMARTCQTCGAVTGVYMVLGLHNSQDDEKEAKAKTYALVNEFAQRFQKLHGSVNCQQLLGCNLGTIEGQNYFRNNKLASKCNEFVRDASIILEDLISLR